MNRVWDIY